MKRSKKLLSLLLCFVLVLALGTLGLAACSDDAKGGTQSSGGVLDRRTISVEIGRIANVSYKGSGVATWTIEDENIATVKPLIGGKMCAVTGVSKGETTLVATYGKNRQAKVKVTVTERNVITVKSGDETITGTLTLERDTTKQLTASSNLGSKKFKWSSKDETVATVSNTGLVTAIFAGKTTITVKVDGDDDTYAEIPVVVTAKAGSDEYRLLFGEESGTKSWVEADNAWSGEDITNDMYFMWHARQGWGQQIVTFDSLPIYSNGVISFKYHSNWNPGLWYGMQILYKNSEHEVTKTYKLNCKINLKSASLGDIDAGEEEEALDKIKVTLNGNVIELNKGINNVEVYYVYTASLGNPGISSFDLQMGWEDPSSVVGWFAQNADVEISDISWTLDSPVTLKTPSFTYADNVVTVSDPNNGEGVEGFLATFYDANSKAVGASMFQSGEDFDTSTLNKGEYTVKIQAVGINAHYLTSLESTTSATVSVTTDASYTLTKNGAIDEAVNKPGTWSYWAQTWVTVTATHSAGVTTLEFGNNDGTYDSLQLYYKNPSNLSDTNYKLTVDIELLKDDDGGSVTLCGNEIKLKPGKHTYEVGYRETANGASFAMLVAIPSQTTSGSHEIVNGTIKVSNYSWEVKATPDPVGEPSNVAFNEETKVITFTEAEHATKGYEVGFFANGNDNPSATLKVKESGEELDLENNVPSGEYTIKVRAKGDGILYAADGAWIGNISFNYVNPNGDTYKLSSNDKASEAATATRGRWAFWTQWAVDKDTNGALEPVYKNGEITVSFANNQGDWWNIQLWIDPADFQDGKEYDITFDIHVAEGALITNDGFKGGADYNPNDHKTTDTTFMITIANQKKQLSVGDNPKVKVTVTKSDPIQILFGTSDEGDYNHISAGVITISDPVVVAK